MMHIEHIALWVKDLELTKDFYCDYFGATANDVYHNPTKGFKSYFLSFEEGGDWKSWRAQISKKVMRQKC